MTVEKVGEKKEKDFFCGKNLSSSCRESGAEEEEGYEHQGNGTVDVRPLTVGNRRSGPTK